MNSKTETNAAVMPANLNALAQEMPGTGEYASVGELKMYYEMRSAGRPLLTLHGSFLSATDYPMLAEGRQIIAADMQGHGRTARH